MATCTIKINKDINNDTSKNLSFTDINKIKIFTKKAVTKKIKNIITAKEDTVNSGRLSNIYYDKKQDVIFIRNEEFPKTIIDKLNKEYFYAFNDVAKIESFTQKDGTKISYISLNTIQNTEQLANALRTKLKFANSRNKVFVNLAKEYETSIDDKTFNNIISTFNNVSDEVLNTFNEIGNIIHNNINYLNKLKNDIKRSNKTSKDKDIIINRINKELSFLNDVKSDNFYAILLRLESLGNSDDKIEEYNSLTDILLNVTEKILSQKDISDASLYVSKLILDKINFIINKNEIIENQDKEIRKGKLGKLNELKYKFEKGLNSFIINKLNNNENFVNLYNHGNLIPEDVDLNEYIQQKIKENDVKFLDFLNDISAITSKFYSQGDSFEHNHPLAQLSIGVLEGNINRLTSEYGNIFSDIKKAYLKITKTLKELGLTDKIFYRINKTAYAKELVSRYVTSDTNKIILLGKLSEKINNIISSSTSKELDSIISYINNILQNNSSLDILNISLIPELSDKYFSLTGKKQDLNEANKYKENLIKILGEKHYNELVQEQLDKINSLPESSKELINLNNSVNKYHLGIFYSTKTNPVYNKITEHEDLYEVYSKLKYMLEKTYNDAPIDVKATGHNHSFLHIPSSASVDSKKNFISAVVHSMKEIFKDIINTINVNARNVNNNIDSNRVNKSGTIYNNIVAKRLKEDQFQFISSLVLTDKYKYDKNLTLETPIKDLNNNLINLLASDIGKTPEEMFSINKDVTINGYLDYYSLYKIAENDTFDVLVSSAYHTSKMAEYVGRYNSLSTVELLNHGLANLNKIKENNKENLKNVTAQFNSWFNQSVLNKLDEKAIIQIKNKLKRVTGKSNDEILLPTYATMVHKKLSNGYIYTKEQKLILRELRKMINDFIKEHNIEKENIIESIYNKINNNEELSKDEEKIFNLANTVSSFIRLSTQISITYGIINYLRTVALGFRIKSQVVNVLEGIISEVFNSYDDYDKIMNSHKALSVALGMIVNKIPGLKNMNPESKKLYTFMQIHSIAQDASNITQRAGTEDPSFSSKASEPFYGYHAGEIFNQSLTVYKALQKFGVGSIENGDFIPAWELMDENSKLKDKYKEKGFKYNKEAINLIEKTNSKEHQKLRNYIDAEIQNNHGNYYETRRTISNEKASYKAFEFLRKWMGSYIANFYGSERADILGGKIKKGVMHQPLSTTIAFQLGISFLYYSNPFTAAAMSITGVALNTMFSKFQHQKTSLDFKSSIKSFFNLYGTSMKIVANDLTLHKINPLKKSIATSFNKYAKENSNYTNVDAGNSRKMSRYLALALELGILQAGFVAIGKAMDDDDDDKDTPFSWAINMIANLLQQMQSFSNPILVANNLFGFGLYNSFLSLQDNFLKFFKNLFAEKEKRIKTYKTISNTIPEPFKSIMQSATQENTLPLLGFQDMMKAPNAYVTPRPGYQVGNYLYRTDGEKIYDEKQEVREQVKKMILENPKFKDIKEKDINEIINELYQVKVLKPFKSGYISSLKARLLNNNMTIERKKEIYKEWTGKEFTDEKDYRNAVKEQIDGLKELNTENTLDMVKFFLVMDNAISNGDKHMQTFIKKNTGKISNVHQWLIDPDKYIKKYSNYNQNGNFNEQITILNMIKQLKENGSISEILLEQYDNYNTELNNLIEAYKKIKNDNQPK